MTPEIGRNAPSARLAVSVAEAANMLSLSRSKVYLMMDAGDIPYLKFGRSRRIALDDLRRVLDRCRTREQS